MMRLHIIVFLFGKNIFVLFFAWFILWIFVYFIFVRKIFDKVLEAFSSSHVFIFTFNVIDNRISIFFMITEKESFSTLIFAVFI